MFISSPVPSLTCLFSFLFPLLKQMLLIQTPAGFWESHWQRSHSRGSSGRLIWNSHTTMMWVTLPGTKLRSPCHIQISCAPWCWPASHIAWDHRWECCVFGTDIPAWSKRSWNGISWLRGCRIMAFCGSLSDISLCSPYSPSCGCAFQGLCRRRGTQKCHIEISWKTALTMKPLLPNR